jgi:hypothetical protein
VTQGTVLAVAEGSDGQVTAITIRLDRRRYEVAGGGESVPMVANVPWMDAIGESHGGNRPSCLPTGSYGQRIEVAVLDVRGHGGWFDRVVTWVHCLS